MIQKTSNTPLVPEDQFVLITRIFNVPREMVFKAWTDPEQLLRWHAPKGCTIHFPQIDPRPGGTFHSCIRTPDGYNCWCKGVYREIISPERLVYTMAMADEKGNLVGSEQAGKDSDWPTETLITVTFADQNGKTKLTLHQTVLESIAKRTGAYPSWIQMLEQLEEIVSAPNKAM